MKKISNKSLLRQLKKTFSIDLLKDESTLPEEIKKIGLLNKDELEKQFFDFIHKIDNSMEQLERDLELRTRTLEISSQEMWEMNEKIKNSLLQTQNANKSNESKSLFLATMSHEIRTPLNAIIGMTDLAIMTEPPKEVLDYLSLIQNSSEDLLLIINDILDFSKIEAGKLQIENQPFQIRTFLNDLQKVFDIRFSERKISLSFLVDTKLPESITTDSLRLRQILNNLLSNALKFTPENGYVEVRVNLEKNNDNAIYFSIKDSGIGIEESKQHRLFNSFSQADSSTTRQFGGTGLGLAISKKLCEMLGGQIGVKSQPGAGSNFFFTIQSNIDCSQSILDLDKKESQLSFKNRIENKISEIDYSSVKILVVEDTHVNQIYMKALFQKLSIKMQIAENGVEALHLYKSHKWDLIFMDIQMPLMDGYEATKCIRQYEADNTMEPTPIVALTANAMSDDSKNCFDVGMNDYLTKPVKIEMILNAINKHQSVLKLEKVS
jgi:signal transduction histidine kinase/CheY-like chemotaxis protein